ncbi:metallophosphoesterase [Candidatus Pacearchaeota archaeon]|nr:metallophosphoesterase [Candidatus Pacearchaeota archaeon]
MNKEILRFCLEKGFLLDEEILKLLSETGDLESAKLVLESVKNTTQKKIITREIFQDKEKAINVFSALPEQNQKKLEKLKIKLGLNIEISKEIVSGVQEEKTQEILEENSNVKVLSMPVSIGKKLELKDFVEHYRNRFNEMRDFLQESPQLNNLISIGKIYGNRQGISLIGMVVSKRITKNNNLLFEIEDLTGKIKVVINQNKKEIYEKAEEIALDSVVGFKGSGSREILFVNEIIFPDAAIPERKKSNIEEYALFVGDLHFGSKRFLENSFLKFIDYLNGKVPDTPEVAKIKYLFIVGDVVTGVGNYPNQERDLKIIDLEEQFIALANILGKIRKDIQIIISPGNHDGVRLMEPQPLLDEKYAWPLYDLENVTLTTNPSSVNIGFNENFVGFDVLTYHGFSFPYYVNNVPRLMTKKAMNSPDLIMKYLLRNRHLAPAHASVQFFPSAKDNLVIKNIPDIFVAGHTHKSTVSYHNNILIISASCWEAMTPYQEKFGNDPDHCKVPMLNLKTREVKILDFEEEEDMRERPLK